MEITRTLSVNNRGEWRAWLERNHDREKEIWLVFFRKKTGMQTVSLTDAMDEALCFGWIDSVEKKIDQEKYALRFTPRRPDSHWSNRTIERAKRMIAKGKMTEAGRAELPEEIR